MKMGKYILSILLIVACNTTKPIDVDFTCDLIDHEIKEFKFDVFGNLYTIDLRNRLKVYDKDLNFLFEYYNNILGEITFVDVSNPKKIMLFFDGFQKIVFVDDTLSEIGRYEGPFNILAAGSSRDNNIWIYDGLDYRLKKISTSGKKIIESNPLESYHELNIIPDYIIEYNNMVYMVEEGSGIAILDNFGNYMKFLQLDQVSALCLKDESMIYLRNNVIVQQLLNAFGEERKIKTVPSNVETAYILDKSIFYLDNKCLKSMSID